MTGSATRSARSRRRTPSRGAALTTVLLACLLPAGARGDSSLSITATLDRNQIEVGSDVATLTVTVEVAGLQAPDVPAPAVPGLVIQAVGTDQSLAMVNGHVSRSVTAVYRVRALRPGTFTIGPIRVKQGKQTADSNPVTLTATPQGAAPPAPRAGSAESWSGGGGPPEIFARVTVDRSRALWNQQITAHLRLYSRVPLESTPDVKPPDTPGFWVEALGQPRVERTSVSGVEYAVSDIAWGLFPTRTGRLVIGPAHLRCRVQHVVRQNDPWGGILNLQQVAPEDVTLDTKPVVVTVDPLPSGAPPEFSGAVGSFTLSVKVDRLSVAAGEPVTVTTTVSGEGNISSLRDPRVEGSGASRRYAAGSSSNIDRSSDRVRGVRTQQTAFLPDAPGVLRIDPVRFAWFDPEAGQYRTARSDTIRVRVGPPGSSPAGAAAPAFAPAPLAERRSRPGPYGSLSLDPPAGSAGVGAGAVAVFALAWILARRRERLRLDPRALRAAALERLLARDLREARSRLAAGRTDAAAALAGEALAHGTALRFDIPRTGETRRELLEAARARGASAAEAEEVASLVASLDALAYAPPETRQGTAAREIERIEALLRRYRGELS